MVTTGAELATVTVPARRVATRDRLLGMLALVLVGSVLCAVTTDLASERAFVIAFWVGGAAAGSAGLAIARAERISRKRADRGVRFGAVSVNL